MGRLITSKMHSAATAVRWIFALWFARIAMCEHVTTMRPVDSFRRPHPSTRRIIGGTAVTNSSKYPWFAQLVKIGGYGTTCGMTIINKNWAVTACHCVIKHDYTGYNSASGSQLKFGCTSKMSPECQVRNIKRWVPHPCYTISCCDDHDDICLAEIDDANLAEYPKVAGLDGLPPVGNSGGVPVTLLGSGATRHYGSGGLREVNIDTTSQATCEAAEPTAISRNLINFNNVICTGGPEGKDSCNGDSGSPMIGCFGNHTWMLGVLVKGTELPKSGPSCGAEGRLAVYTRMELFAEFVRTTVSGGTFSCSSCHKSGGNSCAALLPDKQPTAASCHGNTTGEWREPASWGVPVSSGSDNSSTWIIFVVVGVIAAILILGLAGYLYKRRQRLEVERTTAGAVVEAVSMSPIQPKAAVGSRHEIEPLASGVLNESPTQPVDLEGQPESPITLKLTVDSELEQKTDSETLLASNQKVTVSKADSYAQN